MLKQSVLRPELKNLHCSIFCIVFRPPDANATTLLCFLHKLFDFINIDRYKLVFAGDLTSKCLVDHVIKWHFYLT